jgi:uncharacterized membrane protein YdfJ with MMPL/SSD domain
VSGTTVAIAMAGMYLVHTKVLSGIATGTIAVVACAVVASVTVLPAVCRRSGRGSIAAALRSFRTFAARAPAASGPRSWAAC